MSMAHVKQLSELGRLAGALAHEIRNPLNAIRLNLHAIQRLHQGVGALTSDEVRNVLDESNREIERLSELVKSVLDYARPDQANAQDVDLRAEVESLASFFSPVMDREKIGFRVDLPESQLMTRVDPDRLRQALLNLLNNAREAAGHSGLVALTLQAFEDAAVVRVEDNGPGVPKADRKKIFEAFYSTKNSGTGLGLALAKRFAEEAGGTVVCDSGELGGARFTVTFQRAALLETAS
jgi:signal transduction histidine kinase